MEIFYMANFANDWIKPCRSWFATHEQYFRQQEFFTNNPQYKDPNIANFAMDLLLQIKKSNKTYSI